MLRFSKWTYLNPNDYYSEDNNFTFIVNVGTRDTAEAGFSISAKEL